jgi:hypothetical protein
MKQRQAIKCLRRQCDQGHRYPRTTWLQALRALWRRGRLSMWSTATDRTTPLWKL